MAKYTVAIAWHVTDCLVPTEVDGVVVMKHQQLPTSVDLTTIDEYLWPFLHAAFDRADLTGIFMYTPGDEAAPVIEAAIARIDADPELFATLLAPRDWRNVRQNRAILAKMVKHLRREPDSVIAWGREP